MDTKEYSLLSTFLLSTAALPTIVTLAQFTELFPASQRDNHTIRHLYRDLQHERGLVTDAVKKNLIHEAIRGETQKREIARVRRRAERGQFGARNGLEAREVVVEVEVTYFLFSFVVQS
jgi:NifB/MoaA-like Fe-S oxidoreductase